jgi:uncharacterized protein YggU (UPF0235/DUF167 family)
MYIHVRAHPKSKNEILEKLKDDHFEIWVKEPAEKNLANKKIIELLKNHFSDSNQYVLFQDNIHLQSFFLWILENKFS